MSELSANHRLVSENGGRLDFVSQDGELLASVSVPPGLQFAGPYLDLCPDGAKVELSGGLVALKPRSRVTVQPYGAAAYDTGANPDYRPTSASRMEKEMRLTLNRMRAATSRVEAREKALAKIDRIPKAKASDVIEDDIPKNPKKQAKTTVPGGDPVPENSGSEE